METSGKFAEPEELRKQIFYDVRTSYENNVLYIIILEFLSGTDLKLSVYKENNRYFIRDNGCAVENLLKQIDNTKLQKVLALIWGKSNLQDNKIFTEFTDVKSVLYFIQEVILTVNTDLYYEYFKEEQFGRSRYIDPCVFLKMNNTLKNLMPINFFIL